METKCLVVISNPNFSMLCKKRSLSRGGKQMIIDSFALMILFLLDVFGLMEAPKRKKND